MKTAFLTLALLLPATCQAYPAADPGEPTYPYLYRQGDRVETPLGPGEITCRWPVWQPAWAIDESTCDEEIGCCVSEASKGFCWYYDIRIDDSIELHAAEPSLTLIEDD